MSASGSGGVAVQWSDGGCRQLSNSTVNGGGAPIISTVVEERAEVWWLLLAFLALFGLSSLRHVFCVGILLWGYKNSVDGLRLRAKRGQSDFWEVFVLFFFGLVDGCRKVGDDRCFDRE